MSSQSPTRLRTWPVVLLTVGVMTFVGVAFVFGVLVGAWIAKQQTTQNSTDGLPDSRSASGRSSGGAASGSEPLDPCVVGTWRATEHDEKWTVEGKPARLSGLLRTITVTQDGTETISYERTTATITAEGRRLPAVFDGQVVYQVSTSGGTMSFELRTAEGTVTVEPGGAKRVQKLEPGIGDVSYTCTRGTLRQQAEGYLSVYERVG